MQYRNVKKWTSSQKILPIITVYNTQGKLSSYRTYRHQSPFTGQLLFSFSEITTDTTEYIYLHDFPIGINRLFFLSSPDRDVIGMRQTAWWLWVTSASTRGKFITAGSERENRGLKRSTFQKGKSFRPLRSFIRVYPFQPPIPSFSPHNREVES